MDVNLHRQNCPAYPQKQIFETDKFNFFLCFNSAEATVKNPNQKPKASTLIIFFISGRLVYATHLPQEWTS